MKALPARQFFLFSFIFLISVLLSVPIWNAMAHPSGPKPSGFFHAASIYLLALYGLALLIPRFSVKGCFIHSICLLWCVMMLVVVVFNGGIIGIAKLILWPVIFELSYLSLLYFPQRIIILSKFFCIIFFWSVFLFLTSEGGYKGAVISLSPNTVFTPLLTLPMLLVLKNSNKYRFFVLIVASILVLLSMKRSGMLILAVSWIFYVFPLLKLKNKLTAMILIVCLLGTVSFLFSRVNNALGGQIENRINKEETDTGRNRLAIWGNTLIMIEQSSVYEYIVGHGQSAVSKDSIFEVSAHNDFMEIIYDYGIFTFFIYLGLWVYVLKRWWYLNKTDSDLFFPYTVSVIIFVVMSFVSHLVLYTSYFIFLVMLWGATEGIIVTAKHSKSD